MNEPKQGKRPIGYWLRRADELLTKRIDEVQGENGLNRLEWQILNVVREVEAATRQDIAETLRPFAGPAELEATCDALASRGLVQEREAGSYALSDTGAELYERALAAQKKIREKAMAGISEADYAATLRTLQTIVNNLAGDAGAV